MIKFLNNISLEAGNDIQFKTTAGANAGKIEQDGNNLVLTNAVGDILLGDGSADVYIGDGTNSVDIIFEQSGAIKGDGSAVTLTLGGSNTTLNLENPNINNALTLTGSSSKIIFDYEAGQTGEYTNEVPLLQLDRGGSPITVLSRVSSGGAVVLGCDDMVHIAGGDTKSVIKSNLNMASEIVVLSSEAGFHAYGFPSNDTSWSNRVEFRFRADSGTASQNGLYIGDGGNTQFIDLSRNLKNIGTIDSGAITSTGDIRLPNSGKLYTYTSHDANFLDYDTWQASASAGMTINNTSSAGEIIFNSGNALALTLSDSQNATFAGDIIGSQSLLNIKNNDIRFKTTGDETMLRAVANGAVELMYDNSTKFATTSTGVEVTGNLDSPQISVNDYISHNGDSNTYFGFPTADTINLTTAGAERMRITSAGAVGIGVTSPGAKLHVSDSSAAATANLLYLENTGSGGSEGVSIKFNPMFGATSMIASNREGADSGKTNLTFHNCLVNDAAPIERMRITSAGDVGIGTNSPAGLFHLYDGSPVLQIMTNSGADGQTNTTMGRIIGQARGSGMVGDEMCSVDFVTNPTTWYKGEIAFKTNDVDGTDPSKDATERMRITSAGNVGIATTSPLGKLQVDEYTVASQGNQGTFGNISSFANSNVNNIFLGLKNGAYPNRGYAFRTVAAGVNSDFTIFEHGQGSGEVFRIKASGDVGIGVSNPGYRLEVAEDTDGTADLLMLRNSDATYAQTWGFQSDTNKDLVITGSSGAGGFKFDSGSRGATFTGDIKLPVAKKLYFGGGNHTYIGEDVDDRLRFFTGGAEFMRFTEGTTDTVHFFEKTIIENVLEVDNKVGIGIVPVELLDIQSASGDARIRLDAPSGSDTEVKFFNAGVAQYTIGHDDATDNFVIGGANVDAPLVSVGKTGNATFAGDLSVTGTSIFTGQIDVGSVVPRIDSTFSLGSNSLRFASIYGDGLTITNNGTFGGDVTVSGGDIILGGTGRIQGIDTVSATTDAANKGYVDDSITDLIGGAPGTLNTLNELAAAINDDASYASTLTTALATKLPLTGGTLTGDLTAPGIYVGSANTSFDFYNNGTTYLNGATYVDAAFTQSGGAASTFSGSVTCTTLMPTSHIYLGAAKYLYFDGGGNTSMRESSADTLQIKTGGTLALTLGSSQNATFAGNLEVQGADVTITANVIHAGDGDTYFGFNANNSWRVVTGGSERFKVTGDVHVTGSTDFAIPAGRKLYLDGQSNTYITESSADNIKFFTGGSEALLLNSSQNATFAGNTFVNAQLGVNTTTINSANKLEVHGQARVDGKMMIGDSSLTNTVNAAVQLQIKSAGQAGIRLEDSDSDNLAFDVIVDEGVGFVIKETVGGDSGDDIRLTIAETTGNATFAGNVEINGATGITGLNGITFQNGCILDDSIGAEYLKLKYNGAAAGGLQIFDNQNTIQGYLYADGGGTSNFGLLTGSGQWGVRTTENAATSLFYGGGDKLSTTSTGVEVTGNIDLADGAVRSIIGPTNNSFIIDAKPNSAAEGLFLQINGTNKLSILQDGNATFAGSVTATNILTVAGAATGSPYLQFTQGGSQKAYIQYVDSGDSFELQSDNQFVVRTGGSTTALTINSSQNATFAGDVVVSGGDITLEGTGRIQGIDTVSSGSDAANKDYVDTAVAGVSVGDITGVTAGDGISGGGTSGSVSLAVDSTVVRTTGTQSIAGTKTFSGVLSASGAVKNVISQNYVDVYIYGDDDTYYPVTISGATSHYGYQKYSVSRRYNWTAPSTWNTSTHQGALVLTWEHGSDTAWGGNDKEWRVIQFDEVYSNLCNGMVLPVTEGMVVWLRGGGDGGARYAISTPQGAGAYIKIYDNKTSGASGGGTHQASTTFTAGNSSTYSAESYSSSSVNSRIKEYWPIRGKTNHYRGQHQIYAAIDEDNFASNSATRVPTQQSTKAYVDLQVSNLVDSAPGTLNTLHELATALGDDANFSTTVTNSIATKLPLAGGTLTGALILPDGSTSAPSIGNTGDTNTGMYWPGNHQVGFAVNGSRKFYMSETKTYFQNQANGVEINNGLTVVSGGIGVTGNSTFSGPISISDSAGAAWLSTMTNSANNGHGLLIQAGGTSGTRYITQWKDAAGTERFHMDDTGEAYFQNSITASNIQTSGDIVIGAELMHSGDTHTKLRFDTDQIRLYTAGTEAFEIDSSQNATFSGNVTIDGDLDLASTHKITIGPNTTWSKSLIIGDNANNSTADAASIGTTNGNLHIDAATGGSATYLNFYDGTAGVAFGNGATTNVAWMGPDGDLWKGSSDNNGSKYWHAGNDGSGSGLDADLLDGNHASAFAPSSVVNQTDFVSAASGGTFSGDITLDDNSGSSPSIYLKNGDNNFWRLFCGSSEDLTFRLGTVTKFDIDSSGNGTFTGTVTATGGTSTQWNTAYGWGNHSGIYLSLGGGTMSGDIDMSGSRITEGVFETQGGSSNDFVKGDGTLDSTAYTTNTGTTTASNSQTFTNKSGNISQWTNNSGYAKTSVANNFTQIQKITLSEPKLQLQSNSSPSLMAGLHTQVGGQLLGYGTNFSQIGSRNTSYAGGFFRIDVRSGYTSQFFTVQKVTGTSTETVLLTVNSAGDLTTTGNITELSDERLKSDVKTVDSALDKVNALRGVTFMKNGKRSLGVIAQEIEKVLPEVVVEGKEYKSVAYGNIVGVLIEAIKEQDQKIERLEKMVELMLKDK